MRASIRRAGLPSQMEELIAGQGNRIKIVGYGSLLSLASLERTVGRVESHELARVSGYVRVFDKVCVSSIATGAADPATAEIACCCAQREQSGELLISLSAISRSQFEELLERERVYGVSEVAHAVCGKLESGTALMFVRPPRTRPECADPPIDVSREPGGPVIYTGPLWRSDILPARAYLRRCIGAAREWSASALDNFLDNSFLGDGTPLRSYLARNPDVLGDENV